MNEKEIVRLYCEENLSTYQIAKRMKTYPNKVRRTLVKAGVNLKTKSEAQKNALESGAATIPTEGRQRTEDEKLQIGKAMKKYWSEMDDVELERRREMSRVQWESMSDQEREDMRSAAHAAMREAGKNGSKFEIYLYEELQKAGFNVDFHVKHIVSNEKLEMDMFIRDVNAIIEVDGPSHFLPIWGEERLQKQVKSDNHKNGLALTNGYVVIRLKTKTDSVCYSDGIMVRDRVINLLNQIKDNPPEGNERFIEIEL